MKRTLIGRWMAAPPPPPRSHPPGGAGKSLSLLALAITRCTHKAAFKQQQGTHYREDITRIFCKGRHFDVSPLWVFHTVPPTRPLMNSQAQIEGAVRLIHPMAVSH